MSQGLSEKSRQIPQPQFNPGDRVEVLDGERVVHRGTVVRMKGSEGSKEWSVLVAQDNGATWWFGPHALRQVSAIERLAEVAGHSEDKDPQH